MLLCIVIPDGLWYNLTEAKYLQWKKERMKKGSDHP